MSINIDDIRKNNHRTISKAITQIENSTRLAQNFFADLFPFTLDSIRIGVTGPPGAGKSTLVDQLITEFLYQGKSVGVVAIDPTSPFSGGALLGDRVRMNRNLWNDQVFIRSLGSRGNLGGMSRKAQDVGDILAASGKDIIIFETVGVGQGEYDVAKAVDVTVVVLVPESGDEIQLMKAGLIEIADMFVINKSDREGAGRLSQMLRVMLHTFVQSTEMEPPVLNTIASKGDGVFDFLARLMELYTKMESNGILQQKRIERHQNRVFDLVRQRLLDDFWTSKKIEDFQQLMQTNDSIEISPYKIAQDILRSSQ